MARARRGGEEDCRQQLCFVQFQKSEENACLLLLLQNMVEPGVVSGE
jgi:hypothetical protein